MIVCEGREVYILSDCEWGRGVYILSDCEWGEGVYILFFCLVFNLYIHTSHHITTAYNMDSTYRRGSINL